MTTEHEIEEELALELSGAYVEGERKLDGVHLLSLARIIVQIRSDMLALARLGMQMRRDIATLKSRLGDEPGP